MARPRRSDREEVVAWHAARVRALRQAVAARIDALPGGEEWAELIRRDEDLAAAERALTVLLPEVWQLEERPARWVQRSVEEKVLTDARSAAAVLVMRLQERQGGRTADEERDLVAARALFRYSATVLRGLGSQDPLGPALGGATPFEPLG